MITRDLEDNCGLLEYEVTKEEQEVLKPRGINVIRDLRAHGRGIRVWGARTTSNDPEWRYVNVRRLLLLLEQSIEKGTQWVVFEPNNKPTDVSLAKRCPKGDKGKASSLRQVRLD